MMVLYNFPNIIDFNGSMPYEIYNIGLLFLIIAVLNIVDAFLKHGIIIKNDCLIKSSFFIYAYHALPLLFLLKCSIKLLQPISDIEALLIYILSPFITISCGLLILQLLKTKLPRFTALITGYRT